MDSAAKEERKKEREVPITPFAIMRRGNTSLTTSLAILEKERKDLSLMIGPVGHKVLT
jgi:hypothetical protein